MRVILALLALLLLALPARAQQAQGYTPPAVTGVVSLASCGACDLTGVTNSTAALQAFFNANAGATIWCPPNASLLFTTGNLTLPNATALEGNGSPLGMTHRSAPFQSCTFYHDRAHTIIGSSGGAIRYINVLANDLIANPTGAQAYAADLAWGTDNSIGILVPGSNGMVIEQVFVMGFHWGIKNTGNGGVMRDIYGDDYDGIYNSGNNVIDHAEFQPWYCLGSTNCNSVNNGRPGTAFYIALSTGLLSNLNVEQYAQGAYFKGGFANGLTGEINTALAFAPYCSGPPCNGFGVALARASGESAAFISNSFAHGYSVEYQIEPGDTGVWFGNFQSGFPGLASAPGFVAPVVVAGNSAAGTQIAVGGSATAASTVTATFSGAAPPPVFAILSQTVAGALSGATYYVELTYTGAGGTETTASAEFSMAVSANNVINIASPPPWIGATGYNVYMGATPASEELQNGGTPIALGTAWVEPTSGLVTGTAVPPVSNTTTFSYADTYTIGEPGVPANTSNAALYLEAAINTDPNNIGNHIFARASGSNVVVYPQAAYPTVTITGSATGTLTATQSTVAAKTVSSGIITNPETYPDPYPLAIKLGGGSGWQWNNLPQDNTNNPIALMGFAAGNDVFNSEAWSNTTAVSGTGCSRVSGNLRDMHGLVAQTGTSVTCTIAFGKTLPFPPICSVQDLGGAIAPIVGTPTATGFSWTNLAAGSTQQMKYDCTLNY